MRDRLSWEDVRVLRAAGLDDLAELAERKVRADERRLRRKIDRALTWFALAMVVGFVHIVAGREAALRVWERFR